MKYTIPALILILFLIELLYFKFADKFNIIDKPNKRSSHQKITLRGGGVIFYFGILLYFFYSEFQYPWFFIGLTLITIISFADDIRSQSAKLRLTAHFISLFLLFFQFDLFSFPWYFSLISLIICIGILNTFNFMDGINGMTGGYSIVLALTLLYINSYVVIFIDNTLILFLTSALLVFNFFNFRERAKCFAGDVGSVSIGFIFIFLLGMLIIKTENLSYIVLLAVYGIDAGLTIIHRLILKENILKAHRKHAYQLMANELKIPHLAVSAIYISLQLLITIGLFFFHNYQYIYTACILLVLSAAYIMFVRKHFHLHKIKEG